MIDRIVVYATEKALKKYYGKIEKEVKKYICPECNITQFRKKEKAKLESKQEE